MAATDYVVDASALAKLFLDQAQAEDFRAWFRKESGQAAKFSAPSLIQYELGQVLAREHRGLAAARQEFLERVLDGIGLDASLPDRAFDHAPPLSFYDAAYLALAKSRKISLVTYDRKLRDAAKTAGVRTIAPGA